jgi:hypothetical protein
MIKSKSLPKPPKTSIPGQRAPLARRGDRKGRQLSCAKDGAASPFGGGRRAAWRISGFHARQIAARAAPLRLRAVAFAKFVPAAEAKTLKKFQGHVRPPMPAGLTESS